MNSFHRLDGRRQAADTILFCTILFYGEMTLNFINYTVTGYFYKVLMSYSPACYLPSHRRHPPYGRD